MYISIHDKIRATKYDEERVRSFYDGRKSERNVLILSVTWMFLLVLFNFFVLPKIPIASKYEEPQTGTVSGTPATQTAIKSSTRICDVEPSHKVACPIPGTVCQLEFWSRPFCGVDTKKQPFSDKNETRFTHGKVLVGDNPGLYRMRRFKRRVTMA